MKLIQLLIVIGLLNVCYSQNTYIPDDNFEQRLINLGYDVGPLNDYVPTANINTITNLNISFQDIADLTGIEDFVLLEDLSARNNLLTTIDLSANNNLININLSNNALTTIDISMLSNLQICDIEYNSLLGIDTSQNLLLRNLSLTSNQISAIDITQNTALQFLGLGANLLTTIDVSQNTALLNLSLYNNQLSSIDITANIALDTFRATTNQLTTLDVTQNTNLRDIGVGYNQLTALDLTQNNLMEDIDMSYNDITSIDLTQCPLLETIRFTSNQLNSLDVTQCPQIEFISGDNNNLTTVDTSLAPLLEHVALGNNQLTSMDFSANPLLNWCWIENNQLTTIDVSQNPVIRSLNLRFNALTSLTLMPPNSIVIYVSIRNNQLNDNTLLPVFLDYPNIERISIENNYFSGTLPDYTPLAELRSLDFNDNAFQFGDFENQHVTYEASINSYNNNPQDKVDIEETITPNLGDTAMLSTNCSGSQNNYQWYKDGLPITDDATFSGSQTATLTITNIQATEEGVYNCEVTSGIVTDLTIYRNDVTLQLACAVSADTLNDETVCDSFTLPNLTNGNYYTATNGGGIPLNQGDTITTTQTLYIYNTNGTCNVESNFTITVNNTPTADTLNDTTICDAYTLPALVNGNYYTQANGGGTLLNAGDTITTTQTLYIYNANANCSDESNFTITITPSPTVDILNDITQCDSYTLPALTNGNYFTATNGSGTSLNTGDTITSSQTIYIYITANNCSDESSFIVTIPTTPMVDTIANQNACENYTLPNLTNGNYYTQTGGNGTLLNAGDTITATQTLYIYNTNANCSNESSFIITITPTPTADILNNTTECNTYTLPALTNGNYFTATNGSGTPLNAGDTITNSQTLYIYTALNGCSDESSFTITITPLPAVDTIANQNACENYTLPNLTNGNYYTQTGGNGTQLNAGDLISSSQTIYIYNESNGCSNESAFNITINTTPLVDLLNDETTCDSFTLPTLTNGNYFTASNGLGIALNAGDVVTNSQNIYIYNEANGCTNESSFNITINTTPTVDTIADITACDSFTLPAITNGNYYTQPNGNGTLLSEGDTITSSQTLYIYTEINGCTNESTFNITINTTPPVDTLNDVTNCGNYTLPMLNNGNYFTETNGTGTPLFAGNIITNTQTIYIYTESNTSPNCFAESSFNITINPIVNFTLTQANLVTNEGQLVVNMTDTSIDYTYSLDGINFQNNNSFSNLTEGIYTLYVSDSNGCVEQSIDFIITITQFYVPSYFTPNGDTVHDYWTVVDNKNTIKRISIFDRYGKLLTQLTRDLRWDGTHKGRILNTSDYWYSIELKNDTIIKGHFTLKR